MKELKNNPLARMISTPQEPEKETQLTENKNDKKQGRPRKELARKGSQKGLPEEYTRATFIMKCEQVEELKGIAYTERKPLKEIVEEMATQYIEAYKAAGKEILKK